MTHCYKNAVMRDSSTAGLSKHLNGRRTLLLHRHGDALIHKPFLCAQSHSAHFKRPCSTKPWEDCYFADCQDANGEDEGPTETLLSASKPQTN